MKSIEDLLAALERALRGGQGGAGAAPPAAFPLVFPPLTLPTLPHPPTLTAAACSAAVQQGLQVLQARAGALTAVIERGEMVCEALEGIGEIAGGLVEAGAEQVTELIASEVTDVFESAFGELDELFGDALEDISEAADELLDKVEGFIEPTEEVAELYTEFKPVFKTMAAVQ